MANIFSRPPSEKEKAELLKLGEQCYNNIRDHGAPTWYEWRIKNWRTKWEPYSHVRVSDDTIAFDTAWSGVPNLMQKLSEQYPDVGLSYSFADEDRGSNVGEFEFERGETLYENTPRNHSPEAWRITDTILGLPITDETVDAGDLDSEHNRSFSDERNDGELDDEQDSEFGGEDDFEDEDEM